MQEPSESQSPEHTLTDKQKRFCEEYLVDLNATQAAIRAGYSEDTAKSIGCENLTKPYLRAFIDAELEKKSLSASETTKLITDIAKSSLNDYFVIKQVEQYTTIEKPLQELIDEIKQVIDFEEEYASLAALSEPETLSHISHQASRRRQILRYELRLKRDAEATEKVNGPSEMIEVAELDMVKLVQDKEGGKIKSITPTRFGLNVEMYAADGALRDIAKMHGLYEKDNKQKPGVNLNVNVSKEEADRIISALNDKI